MAGGIWEAIGAALQQGGQSFNVLQQQQVENKRRDEALRMEQEDRERQRRFQDAQLAMDQQNFELQQQDRQRGILNAAIENAAVGTDLSSLESGIQQFAPEMMTRLRRNPGEAGLNVQSGLPQFLGGAAAAGPAATFKQGTLTREANLGEQLQQKQLDAQSAALKAQQAAEVRKAALLKTLQSGGLKDTPANRLLLEQNEINPNNVWGSIEHPSRQTPTGMGFGSGTEALIQTILNDPTGEVFKKVPAQLKNKILPALAAAGWTGVDQTPPSAYSVERNNRVLQSVDELDALVTQWTTGFGSMLSGVPATDAKQFAAKLKTLQSNIMMNELTEMRAASKTGGALGQVSDKEGELLQSSLGALDPSMDAASFKAELAKIRGAIERWNAAKFHFGGGSVQLSNPPGTLPGGPQDAQATKPTPAPAAGGGRQVGRFIVSGG